MGCQLFYTDAKEIPKQTNPTGLQRFKERMSKDAVYEQNSAYEICFLKPRGIKDIRLINICIPVFAEKVCDFKIQTECST